MTFPPWVPTVRMPQFETLEDAQRWCMDEYGSLLLLAKHVQANREQMSVSGHTHTESDITDLQTYALQSITLTAGTGLSGGGTLAADRSFALDINGLTAETSPAEGDFVAIYDASAGTVDKCSLLNLRNLNPFSLVIPNPGASENASILCRAERAMEITAVNAVLVGSASPSVTFQLNHGTDRSAGGSQVFSSGQVLTNVTTGDNLTSFNDPVLTAGEHLWLTTSAQSGTVDELIVTVYIKETG